MKRHNNLYQRICSLDNLYLADAKARKGKLNQPDVQRHIAKEQANIQQLQIMLMEKTFRTSQYIRFIVREPKEREVFRLPYFPDRIVHHAIMNVLEPTFVSVFTTDTYSCIKGKGIHGAANAVKSALRNLPGTEHCLKLDITKFYPSINHDMLKMLLRRKIKDNDLLWLLDEIIDSADGLPIGNYLSQYFANFYLSYFDHWMKEVKGVRYYFRYTDDLVILGSSKPELHKLLFEIKQYLSDRLKLSVKGNYQVFPIASRGIDFVGYRFYHTHTMLRKSIKKNFAKKVSGNSNAATIAAYNGWAKHANCKHLLQTLLKQ